MTITPLSPVVPTPVPSPVEHALSPGGALDKCLASFRPRPEQIALGRVIERGMREHIHVAAEAGTGLGKSLAYLTAAGFSGETVIVATFSTTLQDQLARDLPRLQRAFPALTWCVLKGASRYLCLRDAEAALDEASKPAWGTDEESEALTAEDLEAVDAVLSRANWDGDFANAPGLNKRVQTALGADPDRCTGKECPCYKRCYWQAAKARAKSSDIVITNQAYYAIALAVAPQIMPEHRIVVLDEAHNFEDVVRDHLSVSLTPARINRLVHDLKSQAGEKSRVREATKEVERTAGNLWRACRAQVDNTSPKSSKSTARGASGSRSNGGKDEQAIELPLKELQPHGAALARAVGSIVSTLPAEAFETPKRTPREDDPVPSEQGERAVKWQLLYRRICKITAALGTIFDINTESVVPEIVDREEIGEDSDCDEHEGGDSAGERTIRLLKVKTPERRLRMVGALGDDERQIELTCAPVDVAPALRKVLYPSHTVIALSATLTPGPGRDGKGDFRPLRESIGLPAETLMFYKPWGFDYPRQARTYIARDIPKPVTWAVTPEQRELQGIWYDALSGRIVELVSASRGRAFLLFASRADLRAVYERTVAPFTTEGYTLLSQDSGLQTNVLIDRFKAAPADHPPVLYGLRSFWEGVDVPGDQLSLVVVTRIPYAPHTDPLERAIAETIKARGGDPFRDRSQPQAALQIKQGVGRLIRSETDTGVIAVLDPRILQGIHKPLMQALPPLPAQFITNDIAKVRSCFERLAAEQNGGKAS